MKSASSIVKKSAAPATVTRLGPKRRPASARTPSFLPQLADANAVQRVRAGIPVTLIDALAEALQLTQQSLLRTAGIAPATFARRRKGPRALLLPAESDRIYRIAATCDLALGLFEGDAEAALRWLKEPAKALAGETPFEHLETEAGAAQVRDLVGRLERGVYV